MDHQEIPVAHSVWKLSGGVQFSSDRNHPELVQTSLIKEQMIQNKTVLISDSLGTNLGGSHDSSQIW